MSEVRTRKVIITIMITVIMVSAGCAGLPGSPGSSGTVEQTTTSQTTTTERVTYESFNAKQMISSHREAVSGVGVTNSTLTASRTSPTRTDVAIREHVTANFNRGAYNVTVTTKQNGSVRSAVKTYQINSAVYQKRVSGGENSSTKFFVYNSVDNPGVENYTLRKAAFIPEIQKILENVRYSKVESVARNGTVVTIYRASESRGIRDPDSLGIPTTGTVTRFNAVVVQSESGLIQKAGYSATLKTDTGNVTYSVLIQVRPSGNVSEPPWVSQAVQSAT